MELEELCYQKACFLIENNLAFRGTDVLELTDLLIKLENEKLFKNSLTDKLIDYNDPIVSLEEVGEKETIDISVSGDNLFYCNNILTKNSFGLPQTADFMVALISSEELQDLGQFMVKQLKNRYSDPAINRRFVVGVDRSKMKLYNVEQEAQEDIIDDTPVFDNSETGKRMKSERKFNKDVFEGFS